MKRTPKILFVAVVLIALGVLSLWMFTRGSYSTFPALPSPNGYDDFVTAGNLLSSKTSDAFKMEVEELRAFIGTNSESLRLMQLGFEHKCSVHAAEFLTNVSGMTQDVLATKRLAQFGAAVGRLAELEGRTNEAVTAYLTGMRFGNEVSRGGFVIHRLVGIACEAIARSRLVAVATNQDVTEMRKTISAIQMLENESVSWTEVADNERVFMRTAAGQFNNPLTFIRSWWTARSMIKQAEARHSAELARRRLLVVELALRCYKIAHGIPPKQLDELVPEYLARVPLDPFTERALIYRSDGTNWLLYSGGANCADDGGALIGKSGNSKSTSDDLRYDTPLTD